jgi:hypothetical protein
MNILSQIHIIIPLIYFTILHMILKSMMIGQLPMELTLIRFYYFECNHVYKVMVIVFNITFYNMSVISWRTVLLVEQAPDIPQVTGILYHLHL